MRARPQILELLFRIFLLSLVPSKGFFINVGFSKAFTHNRARVSRLYVPALSRARTEGNTMHKCTLKLVDALRIIA